MEGKVITFVNGAVVLQMKDQEPDGQRGRIYEVSPKNLAAYVSLNVKVPQEGLIFINHKIFTTISSAPSSNPCKLVPLSPFVSALSISGSTTRWYAFASGRGRSTNAKIGLCAVITFEAKESSSSCQ